MWQTWTGGSNQMAAMQSPSSPLTGGVNAPGGWHPTILYMIALVVGEIVLVGFLTRTLLR